MDAMGNYIVPKSVFTAIVFTKDEDMYYLALGRLEDKVAVSLFKGEGLYIGRIINVEVGMFDELSLEFFSPEYRIHWEGQMWNSPTR